MVDGAVGKFDLDGFLLGSSRVGERDDFCAQDFNDAFLDLVVAVDSIGQRFDALACSVAKTKAVVGDPVKRKFKEFFFTLLMLLILGTFSCDED